MTNYGWVGTRLKERRIETGLSAEELAMQIGLDVDLVHSIEGGETQRRFGYVIAMAVALDIDPRQLFHNRSRARKLHELLLNIVKKAM